MAKRGHARIEFAMIEAGTLAERHFTVKELAALWNLSPAAIRRLFQNEPGVLRYGRPKKGHQRDYVTIRIPHAVAQRVYLRCLVPTPPRPQHNQRVA
jgi:predicted transcriptional regulator